MIELRRTHVILLAACLLALWAAPLRAEGLEVLFRDGGGEQIVVPKAKGAGETLDADAAGEQPLGDVVKTRENDVFHGTVKSIGADGNLRMTGAQYEGEVVVRGASLAEIAFSGKHEEKGVDEALMTNGDRVLGELRALTEEDLIMESEGAGIVKLPRKIVTSISMNQGTTALLRSQFSSGSMLPWKSTGGGWALSDGELVCSYTGGRASVHAKLEQKEAVTFVARVQGNRNYGLSCMLILFAENATSSYGGTSIYGSISRSEFYITSYSNNSGSRTLANRSLNRSVQEGTVRFAYDPVASEAKLWLDAAELGSATVPAKLTNGQYVMLVANGPCRVSDLRVLRGVVPPSETEKAGEQEADVLDLNNRDRMSASSVTLTDGMFTVKTAFGELQIETANVSRIIFRTKEREEPRRQKGDVRVSAAGSMLTLQLHELTAEHLIGKSECYGDVKIERGKLAGIAFNIYK